jgi:hypothetical protein
LLPTQYREDVRLFDGIAAELEGSLQSKAKQKKVHRIGSLSREGGAWQVSEGGL